MIRKTPNKKKIDLLSKDIISDPFPTYHYLRTQDPVRRVEPSGLWAISRYKDVKFALLHPELFSSEGFELMTRPKWLPEDCRRGVYLPTADCSDHKNYRSLINKLFIVSEVKKLVPFMKKTAAKNFNNLPKQKEFDFVENFSFPYAGAIVARFTGLDEIQSVSDIRRWLDLWESNLPLPSSEESRIALCEVVSTQYKLIDQLIEARGKNLRQDTVSNLITAESKGVTLSHDMIRNALYLFIAAGYISTVHFLSKAIVYLAREKALFQSIKAEPELIPKFIEEMMRFDPPSHSVVRKTTRSIEMAGVTIPEGESVLILLASANRDPQHYPNPDVFDLYRDNNNDQMAFGYGTHLCIGATLAKEEARTALEMIVTNVNDISCPMGDGFSWVDSIIIHGFKNLPTVFH